MCHPTHRRIELMGSCHSREAQEFLDSRENTVAGGTAWERIAKLVDLSDKAVRSGRSDKTQFRAMLMSLGKDEKVSFFVPSPPFPSPR
jgi:hypothetical protein